MTRDEFDALVVELKSRVNEASAGSAFPLDRAVTLIATQDSARVTLCESQIGAGEISSSDRSVLAFFDVTSVSAAIAIKRLSEREGELAGITTALVDLWGQAEASRSLWFDNFAIYTGEDAQARRAALVETVRMMAPEVISIAFRLSEPVTHYVEFVSRVIS